MRRLFITALLISAALIPAYPVQGGPASGNVTGEFDFYVLALTWSPDFCAARGYKDGGQCARGRNPGFVLHGLWPQYQKGFPQFCSSVPFPRQLKGEFAGLYPAEGLYVHEWRRHGTCSGLSPRDYLALSRRLKEAAPIPPRYRELREPVRTNARAFTKEFQAGDGGLRDNGIAVFCSGSGRFLKEVFFCFDRGGKPAACSAELLSKSARSCGRADFLVRPGR